MSNRSMLEINHDRLIGQSDEQKIAWADAMSAYLSSGNPAYLPNGVTWFGMRHHTSECPMGNPPRGWNN